MQINWTEKDSIWQPLTFMSSIASPHEQKLQLLGLLVASVYVYSIGVFVGHKYERL